MSPVAGSYRGIFGHRTDCSKKIRPELDHAHSTFTPPTSNMESPNMVYYRVWHVALLGVPCSTLGLRWMRKVNVSHRFSPYASKCPVKGCRTMRLLSFPSDGRKSMDLNISWDLAIQNATVDEMRCVDEIHSDGLSSDLQESLDHLLYHPNIFWLNMIMV